MNQTNTFTDKIICDIAYGMVKPNQMVFPTVGIRAFNKDGKGLIASVIPSNEEFFELPGVFLSGVEYKGVCYIFTHNEETGMDEVGTYPSPKLTSEGFDPVYSPLRNFIVSAGVGGPLRTTLFHFDLSHPIDVVAKISYDQSVDLYFIDYKNPDRVINSGFTVTGKGTTRLIQPSQFEGALNIVPISTFDFQYTAQIKEGGSLLPGNIFLYIRYLTDDYTKTVFVQEMGPFSISSGNLSWDHEGLQEQNWAHSTQNISSKKIECILNYLDLNYNYFQIAIVRYSATTENGPAQKNIYLIDKYYSIDDHSQVVLNIYGNEPQVSISFEEISAKTLDYTISKTQVEIASRLLKANVKKSTLDYERDKLILFAANITIGEDYEDHVDIPNRILVDYYDNPSLVEFADANKVFSSVGYFKGQTYPFGVVFRFTDGSESEVFPCTGNFEEEVNLSSPPTIDQIRKGLYTFKTWENAVFPSNPTSYTQGRKTMVTFDVNTAYTYYQNNISSFNSVIGFYIVRGNRIDNLICQGLTMHGYHGVSIFRGGRHHLCSFMGEVISGSNGNTSSWSPVSAAIMPLFRGYLPTEHHCNATDSYYGNCADHLYGGDTGPWIGGGNDPEGIDDFATLPQRRKATMDIYHPVDAYEYQYNCDGPSAQVQYNNCHGLFSPDYLLDPNPIIPENTFISPLFSFNVPGSFHFLTQYTYPRIKVLDLSEAYSSFDILDDTCLSVNTAAIKHLQGKGRYNFTAYMSAAGVNTGIDVESVIHNRDIGTCAYIGIQDKSVDHKMQNLYGTPPANCGTIPEKISIVNLYKNEVTYQYYRSLWSSFNVASTTYHMISVFYPFYMTDLLIRAWHGDCFLQKVWIRTHRWYNIENQNTGTPNCGYASYYGKEYRDMNCIPYQHGLLVGLTVECAFNAGMRNNVVGIDTANKYFEYTFFPKCLGDGYSTTGNMSANIQQAEAWIVLEAGNYLHEAFQINLGYNKLLSDIVSLGYERTEPVHELTKQNRVYNSAQHISGSYSDGYRSVSPLDFKDYNLEDGEIFYIGKNLNYVFIVQRLSITQIFVDEKGAVQTTQGQEMTIANASSFLSDQVRKIAMYGTQHKLSVINGAKGTYGFDFLSRIWWMLTTTQTQMGYSQLAVKDLSVELLINDELQRMFDAYTTDTDAVNSLPEDPLHGSGIVGFSNSAYEEIGMTFLFPQLVTWSNRPSHEMTSRTLFYDERIEGFRGDYPFAEALYFNLGQMLFSQHHYIDSNFDFRVGLMVYRYDSGSDYNVFFGQAGEVRISFIVNGLTEKENTITFVKVFNSMIIGSANVLLDRIEYETQYQKGTYDFKTTQFFEQPEYLEHKWHFPITVQTSIDDDAFQTNSEMTGEWMKVTLVYTGNEDLEIRDIETDYDISII